MTPIEIIDVVKTFDARRALDGVSLDVREGEVLGLLGPNGAGKSTLVRTIMGRVRPDSGEVRIFGKTAPAGDTNSRQQVGVVPQEIALYPLLSAKENALVFARYLGIPSQGSEAAARAALEWAGLTDRTNDIVKTFSGGMKRRLNLAVGTLHKPRVLLLDEPTVGVDPQSRERLYQMIESVRAEGVSVVYTTHYMEEAERLCDRIAVIDHGKVIAAGTKEELVRATIGSQRDVVIECAAQPDDALQSELTTPGTKFDGTRITHASARSLEEMVRIVKALETRGVAVQSIEMKEPTLERVFLHLTGRELRD
jgi:ABC-2 type transport system ATP-binding protein